MVVSDRINLSPIGKNKMRGEKKEKKKKRGEKERNCKLRHSSLYKNREQKLMI